MTSIRANLVPMHTMQSLEDLAKIISRCNEHSWTLSRHCQHTHGVLWIRLHTRGTNKSKSLAHILQDQRMNNLISFKSSFNICTHSSRFLYHLYIVLAQTPSNFHLNLDYHWSYCMIPVNYKSLTTPPSSIMREMGSYPLLSDFLKYYISLKI